jgi:hypothetical protein
MHKKFYLGLAVAALFSIFIIVSGGICLAQGSGGGEGQVEWMNAEEGEAMAKAFIAFEDKNDDKVVTQDEFGGPDSMFKTFDKDENASIDITEAPKTKQEVTDAMGSMGGGEAAPGGAPGAN